MRINQRFLVYSVAIGSTAIALLLSIWLETLIYRTLGAFFYLAVVINTWYYGSRSGMVTVILSTMAVDYYFFTPQYQFWVDSPVNVLRLGIFFIVALVINLITSNLIYSKHKIQQLSQQLVQENAEQLRLALSAAHMGLWDVDMVTEKMSWSPEHEQLFGFQPGTFDGKYDTFTQCVHPDDISRIIHTAETAIATHHVFKSEYRIIWGDGSIHWIEARGKAFYNEMDQPLRLLGTVMSIDDRKKAQAALQQREATLALFAQYAPAGIAMFDRDMRYLMVSQRWIEDYQLNPITSLIGRSHYEIFPNFPERWRQIHQRCLAGAVEKCDQDLYVRVDGTQQWIRWEAYPWYNSEHEIGGIIIFAEDITERKKTEDALAKEVLRLQTLFNTSFDGIVILDSQGKVMDANPRFAQMLGYTPQEITKLKISDWDAKFNAEEIEQIQRENLRLKRGVLETQHRRKDGSIFDVEISFSILEWEGECLAFCVCRDISDRKQAQIALQQINSELELRVAERTAQLRQANDRLLETVREQQHTQLLLLEQAQLLDLAHDTIMTCDLNGVISFWNEGAKYMYGWQKAEALGKNAHQLLKTQFPQPLAAIQAQLLEYGYWEGELTHFNRDQQPLTVASRWVLQTDNLGKPIKILEINNDITANKQAQAALRHSEEKFRQLAENIQAVFWMKDSQNCQVLYVSQTYENVWQRSCASLYENATDWLNAIHPDDRQRVEDAFAQKVLLGSFDIEYRIVNPDGTVRWIRDRAFPIKNEMGETVRIAGIAEDITERQKIEQMKSEFIGIVSHELRTPLTAIRAALGLLQTGIYDHKPEKFKRMIEIAAIDSDRLVRLVNDILDLERLESGRAFLEKTICNAADLIQQAVEGVQAIAKQQNITFHLHTTDVPVWAAADAIIQTLTNLIGNAIKFSPPDATITISVKPQIDHVLFQISDQGRGIPSEKLEAIFGRFQQVDVSDSRAKGGTGLGLAICRSIVDQHHGKIWAESTVGVGSTFFFTLPIEK